MGNIVFGGIGGIGRHGDLNRGETKSSIKPLEIQTEGMNFQEPIVSNLKIGMTEIGEDELREMLNNQKQDVSEKPLSEIAVDLDQSDFDRLPEDKKAEIMTLIKSDTGVKFGGLVDPIIKDRDTLMGGHDMPHIAD